MDPARTATPEPGVTLGRVPEALRVAAAERLIASDQPNRREAAERLIAQAAAHRIDLRLLWGTIDTATNRVREAALIVPGSGATGMMFVSCPVEPSAPPRTGELGKVIERACAEVAGLASTPVRVVQCLPEPGETWTIDACRAAGLLEIGTLEYLRRPFKRGDRAIADPGLPPGVEATPMRDVDDTAEHAALVAALEATYANTLDCPELCGMRETADVIDSHRSTGAFDPSLWWLIREHGAPAGCLLLNPCRELGAVELVYLGLAPSLRGRGVGRAMMLRGIRATSRLRLATLACAVDGRNGPARKLYASLGFRAHSQRVPFVRAV